MRARRVGAGAVSLVLLVVVGGVWWRWQSHRLSERAVGVPAPPFPGAAPTPTHGPADILRAWDRSRAAAYAEADPAALRALYAAGSAAGRRDVRMLRSYRARGLRVTGLSTQLLRVETVARRDDRIVLRVTDRVVGALAVALAGPTYAGPAAGGTGRHGEAGRDGQTGRDGRTGRDGPGRGRVGLAGSAGSGPAGLPVRLPGGTARDRVVTLVRQGRAWLVGTVRPVGPE